MPSRYGDFRYAEGSWSGPSDPTLAGRGMRPWRINKVRVEAFRTDDGLPTAVPGESATYHVQLDDRAPPTAPTVEDRRQALLRYIRNGEKVVTYRTIRGTYYRNQADANQLVLIEPIADTDPGTDAEATPRDSPWEGRWAVVTGGDDLAPYPDEWVNIELETVTIARQSDFATRRDVEAARERSDL